MIKAHSTGTMSHPGKIILVKFDAIGHQPITKEPGAPVIAYRHIRPLQGRYMPGGVVPTPEQQLTSSLYQVIGVKPRNPQQNSIPATSRNSTSRTAGCHLYKPHPRRHSQTKSRRRVKSKAAHTLSIQGHRPQSVRQAAISHMGELLSAC